MGEDGQPLADLSQRVDVVPGVPGEKRDLGRPKSIAQHIEQREVLERVGTDCGFAALDLFALAHRHQLRGDLGVEYRRQGIAHLGVELPRADHPPDEMLDQGFRHATVDVVVTHLVAHTVGRPPQGKLREVTCAQHDAAALVGDAE